MNFQGRFDLKHWMVGITFNRYTFLVSIGPISLILTNVSKYQRDEQRAMEEYLLVQQELMGGEESVKQEIRS